MMQKKGWVISFVGRARELRPEIGMRFAETVAVTEWPSKREMAPHDAADEWVKRSAKNVVPRKG
jgi:hypothetical protein